MKVAIIGAGACGLVLGSILENNNIEYTIFEKSLIGRKILASGNGKANIGNINLNEKFYHYNKMAFNIVSNYYHKLINYFKDINLYTKVDEEGRIYPLTESSLSVIDCINPNKNKIIENYNVDKITKINGKYYINDIRGPYDYVVCSTGSIASFIKKKQVDIYSYLASLNLKINNTTPSLVGFKCSNNLKRIFGVRVKCVASLLKDNKMIYSEAGEIIFKQDGISGICILNLSSYYAHLKDKKNCVISLDLIPNINVLLKNHNELIGLVHPKLVDYFKNYDIENVNKMLHNFKLDIIEPYDYEFAQVVVGGIDSSEINDNLSLIKDNNIFVGGELIDVDGMCGGYNLMFAFCCALKIGEELCNIK